MIEQLSLARLSEELRSLNLHQHDLKMRVTPDGYRIYDGETVVGELSRRIVKTRRSWTWRLHSSPRRATTPVQQRDTAIALLLRAYAEKLREAAC